jgi:hypothetical protein
VDLMQQPVRPGPKAWVRPLGNEAY